MEIYVKGVSGLTPVVTPREYKLVYALDILD